MSMEHLLNVLTLTVFLNYRSRLKQLKERNKSPRSLLHTSVYRLQKIQTFVGFR